MSANKIFLILVLVAVIISGLITFAIYKNIGVETQLEFNDLYQNSNIYIISNSNNSILNSYKEKRRNFEKYFKEHWKK